MNPETKNSQILIIEDNEDDSHLLLRELQRAELDDHVKIISHGQEALDYLLTSSDGHSPQAFVAVFLDLRLPGLDGVPLLREVRATPRLKDLPVLVMTSSNDPRDIAECRELNVTAYVTKPVTLTSFIKAVAHVFPPAKPKESV